MAPLSSEPDAIRVVLNMARRKVLYGLVSEIIAYMRWQLELQRPGGGLDVEETNPPPYSAIDGERDQEDGARRPVPSPHSEALVRLRKAALLNFDSWRIETLGKLKEVVAKADDQKVIDIRRKRAEELSAKARSTPISDNEDLLSFDSPRTPSTTLSTSQSHGYDGKVNRELEAFQSHYHPIPTRLTTIPLRDREEVLSAILLLMLSGGTYSAYSRTLICYLASALEIAPSTLNAEETAIATTMVSTAQKASAEAMSADMEAQKRRDEGRAGRLWKVGLASVAGAAIVGVTGGLAAPVVAAAVGGLMSSVGLGGLAGFLGIFWMNGALVGTLFGAFGAKMTGEIVDRYAKEVEDFKFLPLNGEWGSQWKQQTSTGGDEAGNAEARRLRVTIGVNGWLENEEDVTKPWRVLGPESEVFALRYEMSSLMALGAQLRALVGSAAWNLVRAEILRRTVLVTLQSALWPIFLLNSASNIDNPFSFARNRSEKAGRILADALINKVQGERPVTLIGYSLGARVIYVCLRTLAEQKAFGLVDTVVLIGAPVPSNAAHWGMMRSVVAGKLYNVHSENDYILGFLYRSTSLQLGIAGLQNVGAEIEGVEDLDLSEEVHGHLRYPGLIAQILHRCGFAGVKGGESVIEKEVQVGIQLRDEDYAELGNLIDIGDNEGPKPLLPPRRTAHELANEKFDPMVKDVLEQKSDSGTLDMKLMSRSTTLSPLKSSPGVSSQSAPDLPRRPDLGARVMTSERSASISHLETHDGPIRSHDIRRHDSEDEEDDEYGDAPITMLDDDELSDGELTIVEPLSIDDEPLR
ncbi:hypothetical protein GQX73_g8545 [Xylaria multiplex]|uniref:DUF726 domain-containing protein n=1 Tax=Xylaria multiplex TaxID=323545 RepID=A0A7C8IJI0_9PEZI|nr:hypothetical protein GQX73_g8545 [Xylaria multiplex]